MPEGYFDEIRAKVLAAEMTNNSLEDQVTSDEAFARQLQDDIWIEEAKERKRKVSSTSLDTDLLNDVSEEPTRPIGPVNRVHLRMRRNAVTAHSGNMVVPYTGAPSYADVARVTTTECRMEEDVASTTDSINRMVAFPQFMSMYGIS